MNEEVTKFSFFRSFWEGLTDLGDSERLAMYDAIAKYAFTGEEPAFTGLMMTAWKLAKPNIESSVRGQQTGGLGGRPPKGNPPSKPPVKTPSETNKDMDKDMDGDMDMDMDAEMNSSEMNSFSASASDGAAAADAAPPSTLPPRCPECNGLMKIDVNGGFFRCRDPKCRATIKPSEIMGCLREVKNG